jgi:hypothetical protein
VNVVTPAAPSAFAAPTHPEPAPWTPPPIPPTTRANPTTRSPPVAKKSSRTPLLAIAGVLVLGGAAAIYFTTRTPATKDEPGSASEPVSTTPDPWNGHAPPADAGPDPWNPSR